MGAVSPDQQADPGASDDTLVGLVRALGGVPRAWASPTTWRAMANLVVSAGVAGLFAAAIAVSLVGSLATAWIVGVGASARAGTLRLSARMARVDRRRIERLSEVRIEPLALPRIEPGSTFRARQQAWARSPWLWRLPAYQLAHLAAVAALGFWAVTWWWATVVCFVLAGQPSRPVQLLAWSIGSVSLSPGEMAALVIAGVLGLLAWPAVVRAVPALDVALGRWLLGPSRTAQLSSEVVRLGEARSLAISSAEAERRRIERDLHDGLQPEGVNLALDLGLAKSRLRSDPDAAWSLIERAHDEAKRAAADLRNLVRGIHPSVLDERGLDAALSGLVASANVPVAVNVDLPQRPPPGAEATAYFVVAEAITNVTKHAQAQRAVVTVDHADGTLRVVVEDDGRGGAHLEPEGGLGGLAARVASIDGTFSLTSPDGGPTRLEAVIPCAVVIADDSVLLREGISRLLAEGGIEVAAGAGNAEALLVAVEKERPDLAIVDVRMPPTHRDEGLRAIEIRRRWPDVALLVLSQFVEERYATELLSGNTRAVGYLLKDRVADVDEFIESVRRVADGGTALDPEVVRQLLARTRRADPLSRLTPKEREVLGLMAEGRSNAAIAESLVVSMGAVEKHVASIFMKLDLAPDDEQHHRRVMAVVRYLNG